MIKERQSKQIFYNHLQLPFCVKYHKVSKTEISILKLWQSAHWDSYFPSDTSGKECLADALLFGSGNKPWKLSVLPLLLHGWVGDLCYIFLAVLCNDRTKWFPNILCGQKMMQHVGMGRGHIIYHDHGGPSLAFLSWKLLPSWKQQKALQHRPPETRTRSEHCQDGRTDSRFWNTEYSESLNYTCWPRPSFQ